MRGAGPRRARAEAPAPVPPAGECGGDSFAFRPAARGGQWRRHVGENNHHQSLQRPGIIERLHAYVHELRTAIGANLDSVQHHAFFSCVVPSWNAPRQFITQPFARHDKDVPVRLAGGRLQIFSGAPADVKNVAGFIGEHGGRGVSLQHQLISQRLQAGRRFGCRTFFRARGRAGGEGRGKGNLLRAHEGFDPPEEA